MTLEETAKEIVADSSTAASAEEVHAELSRLVNDYRVREEEAERSVRREYDAVADRSPSVDTRAAERLETLDEGGVAAVRTVPPELGPGCQRDRKYVVAGVVELAENISEGWVATLHNATAWTWEPGKPETAEPYPDLVDDIGPPKNVRRGYEDEYNTKPGLHISDRGELEVLTLDPVLSSSRAVECYMPSPLGLVEAAQSGQIVEPRRLIPSGEGVE
jgi:uncharacterized protein (UPF0147 family)